jgi:AmmeMemoRadiSam system protein A
VSPAELERERGERLVGVARDAIARALGRGAGARAPGPGEEWLDEVAASFVTLHEGARLQGCIGTLEPHASLFDDVQSNAVSAALRDPRGRALSAGDVAGLSIEVSVLGAFEPMAARTEAEALAELRPGEDGVVLSCPGHRATYLPSVWSALPEPRDFLRELRRKARLPADYWSSDVRLARYHVAKWQEGPAEPRVEAP